MEGRRVVVTGLGIVSCLGNDVAAFWKNLVDGVSANDVVEKLIALKGDVNMFKQGDPASFLRTMVAEVGIDTKACKDTAQSQTDILKSVENQRLSVSGV